MPCPSLKIRLHVSHRHAVAQGRKLNRRLALRAGKHQFDTMANQPVRNAVFSALPVVAASLAGNAFTLSQIKGWYTTLVKPSFNPPNWVFGPVWTVLFVMMAYAVYRIWQLEAGTPGRSRALIVFYVQLALNAAWSGAFFGLNSPVLGLVVIVLLLAMIIATIVHFRPLDRIAALLLVPYAAWVSYATLLNAMIWWLNR
jgi:translocator protein